MLWRGLEFGWGQAAWLLSGAVLIALAYLLLNSYRRKKLLDFGEKSVLEMVSIERAPLLFWTKTFLLCVVWVCGVCALMQPQGNPHLTGIQGASSQNKESIVESQRRHDIAFLIDVSASMGISDNGQGNAPRLSVAKEIADAVISRLKGENVLLEAFTSQSLPIVPLTTDYLFTRLMLRRLNINEGETAGTNFLEAINGVSDSLVKTPTSIAKTMIILSDGGDTAFNDSAGKKHRDEIFSAINALKDKGVRIITVGLGSKEGKVVPDVTYQNKPVESSQNEEFLQSIASPKGYLDADMESPLKISQLIGKDIDSRTVVHQVSGLILPSDDKLEYDHYFQYPLAIALASLALFLILPDTFRRKEEVEILHKKDQKVSP